MISHISIETFQPKPQSVKISLLPSEKYAKQKEWLIIWFDAYGAMIAGGRSVEDGDGPCYYKTFGELIDAIKEALDREPEPK